MYGDEEKSVDLLLSGSDDLAETEKFAMPSCSPAIEIAWAHRKAGDAQAYAELVDRCRNLMIEQRRSSIEYFELDYLAARIDALEGEPSDSLAALSRAVDKGWREWWTESDPLLDPLHGREDFQAIVDTIRSDLARQKAEARELFAVQ
jgi:hypothetical protein